MADNNTLNRYIEQEINGKIVRLQYTIRSLVMCEKMLDSKSILRTIADPPLSYNDSYILFYAALVGGDKNMTEARAEELMLDYLDEHNLGELQDLVLEALIAYGTLGKIGSNEKN